MPTRCVAVLAKQRDKVLLVRFTATSRNLTGSYAVPGGVVKKGETQIQAALRKFENETGLKTTAADLVRVNQLFRGKVRTKKGIFDYSLMLFLCLRYSGRIRPTPNELP